MRLTVILAALLLALATDAQAFQFQRATGPGTTGPTGSISNVGGHDVAWAVPTNVDFIGAIDASGCGKVLVMWDPDHDGTGTTPDLTVFECAHDSTVSDIANTCFATTVIGGGATPPTLEVSAPTLAFSALGVAAGNPAVIDLLCLDARR